MRRLGVSDERAAVGFRRQFVELKFCRSTLKACATEFQNVFEELAHRVVLGNRPQTDSMRQVQPALDVRFELVEDVDARINQDGVRSGDEYR